MMMQSQKGIAEKTGIIRKLGRFTEQKSKNLDPNFKKKKKLKEAGRAWGEREWSGK